MGKLGPPQVTYWPWFGGGEEGQAAAGAWAGGGEACRPSALLHCPAPPWKAKTAGDLTSATSRKPVWEAGRLMRKSVACARVL